MTLDPSDAFGSRVNTGPKVSRIQVITSIVLMPLNSFLFSTWAKEPSKKTIHQLSVFFSFANSTHWHISYHLSTTTSIPSCYTRILCPEHQDDEQTHYVCTRETTFTHKQHGLASSQVICWMFSHVSSQGSHNRQYLYDSEITAS